MGPVLVKPKWFEVRPPFQWTSMLMNPMVMMMGVTLLIMFAMPKMMANMDPEQLEEMKAIQGSMGGSWKDMLDPEKLKEKQQALPLGAALDQICLGRRTVCFRCLALEKIGHQ